MLAKVITHTPPHIIVQEGEWVAEEQAGGGKGTREIKVCLQVGVGEEGESGGTVIGCMQIYRGGLRKDTRLERERQREGEIESRSDSQSDTFERNTESERWQ